MSEVVQVWAWGEDWSPITVVDSGSILTLVYYPHKAMGDIIITHRAHPVHCCICDEDVAGTKPHTRGKYRTRALVEHLKGHGRRTRKQNAFIVQAEAGAL